MRSPFASLLMVLALALSGNDHRTAAAASRDPVVAVCDTVATLWRLTHRANVRQADTVADVVADSVPRHGCVVTATAPNGLDSLQEQPLYWTNEPSHGWTELIKYDADGPDGGSRTMERRGVRCQIDFMQDGGDDSDSTYIPSPEITERTFCWRAAP